MILQDFYSIEEECKQAAMKTESSRNQELLLSCSQEAANSYKAGQVAKGTDLTSGVAREMILSLDKEVQLPHHITEEETTEGMKTPVFHSFHSFVISYLPT